MSISREHGGSDTIVVCFFFQVFHVTTARTASFRRACASFVPSNERRVLGSGLVCVDRLSHEIRIAIKFRG